MDTAERERALAALRAPKPVPDVLTPARLARPGEVPSGASALVKAAVAPWHACILYAVGPIPYTWERRAAGHVLGASVRVLINHPDGRTAVAVWATDTVSPRTTHKPARKALGPVGPDVYELDWSAFGAWRWRVCRCDRRAAPHPADIPIPIGIVDLRKAVATPDHVPAPTYQGVAA